MKSFKTFIEATEGRGPKEDPGGGYKPGDPRRAAHIQRFKEKVQRAKKRIADLEKHIKALQAHRTKHKGTSNWNISDDRDLQAKITELRRMKANLAGGGSGAVWN